MKLGLTIPVLKRPRSYLKHTSARYDEHKPARASVDMKVSGALFIAAVFVTSCVVLGKCALELSLLGFFS